ncbi:hypothetical protein OPV22_000283 [Ensete ventricosum]|uniref:Uncharacterized protein n=1 Tax=Ensete ventricosum TaxID=4639 RepID=A0AAV8RU18_ENSVE|nr:hypothetical protein OPV22_000283 [Ensete ventricosum]
MKELYHLEGATSDEEFCKPPSFSIKHSPPVGHVSAEDAVSLQIGKVAYLEGTSRKLPRKRKHVNPSPRKLPMKMKAHCY